MGTIEKEKRGEGGEGGERKGEREVCVRKNLNCLLAKWGLTSGAPQARLARGSFCFCVYGSAEPGRDPKTGVIE